MKVNDLLSPLSVLDKKAEAFSTLKSLYSGRAEQMKKGASSENFGLWTVDIQPTSTCNQKCVHCSNKIRNERNHHLSKEVMDQIHDDLEYLGAKGIIYSGGGEPLSWNDNTLVDYIKGRKISAKIALVTNGVLFNRVLEADILDRFFFIEFSLNSHDSEMYKLVANADASQFDDVTKFVRDGIQLKKRMSMEYPVINGKAVFNKKNYLCVNEIYSYLKSFDFDYTFLRLANNYEENNDVELTDLMKNDMKNIIIEKMQLNDKEAIINQLFSSNQEMKANKCWTLDLNHNAIISTDGNVYICSPSQGNLEYSIGNVNEKPLKEIWNSSKHQEVRDKLHEAMRTGKCFIGACRHNKFNLTIDEYLNNRLDVELDPEKFYFYHACFL